MGSTVAEAEESATCTRLRRGSTAEGLDVAERTVRFYELVSDDKQRLPNQLDFGGLRELVRDVPDDEAYVQISRMELLGSIYAPPRGAGRRPTVPLIALDRITRDVRLRIERRRNYRPLTLAQDETLAEPTFYSIFDKNVLGVMRNSGSAPGPASFRDYVNKLNFFDEDIGIAPLSDPNIIRALTDVEVLTKFEFAVGADVTADVFGQSQLVAGAIRHVREELGNVAIEVSVKLSPTQSGASEKTLDQVRGFTQSDAMAFVDKASISYRRLEDGRADTYDFLNEAVALPVEVVLNEDTSQPTEPSAAEAMALAYNDLYDDIRSALKSTS
jgi:hypothetical protein